MLRYEARWLTPELCREDLTALVVFGDNLQRRGSGPNSGQAVIRGEPNAVGIPTKREPSNDPRAFLTDADLPAIRAAATPAFTRLAGHLRAGGVVVWPAEGIGTGRARLRESAPRIWDMLERARRRLEEIEPEQASRILPEQPSPSTRIEDHPFVRAVMIAWPGAEIVAVRDLAARDESDALLRSEDM